MIDPDADGVSDVEEDLQGSDPLNPDSNSDGVRGVGVFGFTRKAKFQARIYNAETGQQNASAYYPMF